MIQLKINVNIFFSIITEMNQIIYNNFHLPGSEVFGAGMVQIILAMNSLGGIEIGQLKCSLQVFL